MRFHQTTARSARLTTLSLLALLSLGMLGCAALQPGTEGSSGPLIWQATDPQWQTLEWEHRERYSFTLVLQETTGTPITFTTLAVQLKNSPGSQPVGWKTTGPWTLPAHGTLRLPLTSSRHCPYVYCVQRGALTPQWSMTLSGSDGHGNPVRYALQVRLPAAPSEAHHSVLTGPTVSLIQSRQGTARNILPRTVE